MVPEEFYEDFARYGWDGLNWLTAISGDHSTLSQESPSEGGARIIGNN
jgi:hypothetical protein